LGNEKTNSGKKTHARVQRIAERKQPESGATGSEEELLLLVPEQLELLLPLVFGDLLAPLLFQITHDVLSLV